MQAFNELKLGKGTVKYVIYKLSDDYKEIVVEDKSSDNNWEDFRQKLLNAKAAHKGKQGKGPRYAVYDFEYELEGGEGKRYVEPHQIICRISRLTFIRSKITFISWSPDEGALIGVRRLLESFLQGSRRQS